MIVTIQKYLLSILALTFSVFSYSQPKISIITSLYKSEQFIRHFLEDITQQTIYTDCEHIIINANSPENEEPVILEYCKKFPNIRYRKLSFDPGLYAVWNIAIMMAKGEYITNANTDDRNAYTSLETLLNYIEENPDVDLVYSNLRNTHCANTSFSDCNDGEDFDYPEFSFESVVRYCTPGNHPLWRRSLHERVGLFDCNYQIAGDYEMWIRAVLAGSKFKKYPEVLGLFYCGTTNLSFSDEKKMRRAKEHKMVRRKYKRVWPASMR